MTLPTIQDVARTADVGVGTVSRVLNNSPLVSEATRARVQQVIDDFGYRPSPLARALSLGYSTTVAAVIPYFTRPSVVLRLRGLADVIGPSDFDLVLYDVETPEQRDRRFTMMTRPARSAGMIMASLAVDDQVAAGLRESGAPAVFIDRRVEGLRCVWIDDVAGGESATRYLLGLGHERIAFVGDVHDEWFGFTSSYDRLDGYRQALAAAGLPDRPEYVRLAPHGREEAHRLTGELLSLPDPPTAVFAASDLQAFGVLEAARTGGLTVPGGLSVIGFDDIEVSPYLGLTTVRQPLYESGVRGAELLLGALAGDDPGETSVQLPLEIVERWTTGPPGSAQAPTR